MTHMHARDALTDPQPFVMLDTRPRLASRYGLAFREFTPPTRTARASLTRAGLVKTDEIS
jgi:hypothetical protein